MEKKKILRLFAFQIIWVCFHSHNVRADPDSDKNMDLCVNGNCPWCLEIAPFFAKCEDNGEGYKFGHIMDCTKYFTCERNPEECERTPWGRLEHNCPEGQYFDVIGKECIASLDCPQECPPKADEKTGCKIDGTEPSKESDDCRSGVGCFLVETCPASFYEPYWTAGPINCTGKGEFYHAKHGKCVKAMACPQSVPEENCNLKWDFMAEKGWNMGWDNDGFCRSWNSSLGQYSYGSINWKSKKCIVEKAKADRKKAKGMLRAEYYEVLSKDNNLKAVLGASTEQPDVATYTFLGKKYLFIVTESNVGKRDPSDTDSYSATTPFGEFMNLSPCPSYKLICK